MAQPFEQGQIARPVSIPLAEPVPQSGFQVATQSLPTSELISQPTDLTEEIIFMECQTWEALKQSGQALLPYLEPDCIMIFAGAEIFDANSDPSLYDILARPDMKPWLRYEMSEIHVLPLGFGAAAISYSVEAHREEKEYVALVSSVWRRNGDGWRMCLHQQTPKYV